MRIGKLTDEQLESLVLSRLPKLSSNTLSGAGIGADCAWLKTGENLLVTYIIHAHDHVDTDNSIQHFTSLRRCLHPHKLGRITDIKVNILTVYLGLYLSVLFEDKGVIVAADHQDFPDTELDKGLIISPFQLF